MRRLIALQGMSSDGRFADREGGLQWQSLGPAHTAYSMDMLDEVDSLLLGRRTYEMMKSFRPTEQGQEHSPQIEDRMNRHLKLVASHRALEDAWWPAHRLGRDLVESVAHLKSQPGQDIAILSSRSLIVPLATAGFVDEIRISVNPVILGEGPPSFKDHVTLELALASSRSLDGGAIPLIYRRRSGTA